MQQSSWCDGGTFDGLPLRRRHQRDLLQCVAAIWHLRRDRVVLAPVREGLALEQLEQDLDALPRISRGWCSERSAARRNRPDRSYQRLTLGTSLSALSRATQARDFSLRHHPADDHYCEHRQARRSWHQKAAKN